MEILLSSEEWADWLQIPVTQTFRKLLRVQLEARKNEWVEGCFQASELNAKVIGACQCLRTILELTAEQINEGLSDEE